MRALRTQKHAPRVGPLGHIGHTFYNQLACEQLNCAENVHPTKAKAAVLPIPRHVSQGFLIPIHLENVSISLAAIGQASYAFSNTSPSHLRPVPNSNQGVRNSTMGS
mgnify:CR=1 FL=1